MMAMVERSPRPPSKNSLYLTKKMRKTITKKKTKTMIKPKTVIMTKRMTMMR